MPAVHLQSAMPAPVQVKKMAPRKERVVGFPSTPVTGVSRPATAEEIWAMYEFEVHAIKCAYCRSPYQVQRSHQQLCHLGHSLAKSVAKHVYLYADGHTYSRFADEDQLERVEVPSDYLEVRSLLKAMEKDSRHRRQSQFVTMEPRSRSRSSSRSSDRGKPVQIEQPVKIHRPRSGEIVDWPAEQGPIIEIARPNRRGSLYESDIAERQQNRRRYNIEVREPSRYDLAANRHAGYYR